jgi:hypothetical protein
MDVPLSNPHHPHHDGDAHAASHSEGAHLHDAALTHSQYSSFLGDHHKPVAFEDEKPPEGGDKPADAPKDAGGGGAVGGCGGCSVM